MTDAEKENKEKKPRRSRKDVVNYDLTGVIEAASQALRKATGLWEQALEAHRQALEALMQSEEWPKLQEIFPDMTEEEGLFAAFMSEELIEYGPEIKEVLREYEAQEGRPLTFNELLEREAPSGPDGNGIILLEEVLYKARQIRKDRRGELPNIGTRRPLNDPVGLKQHAYISMLNANITNGIMRLTIRDFEQSENGTVAYYTGPNGQKYTIDQFDKLMGNLDVPAKKIFDTATAYLTQQNHFRAGANVNPTVLIPFIEYGEANGYSLTARTMPTKEEQDKENKRVNDRKKELRKRIRRDLTDLEYIKGSIERTKGDRAGEYAETRFISTHRVIDNVIRVNFDIDFARYMVNVANPMPYPTILLRVDNRKPNTYSIGRKLAQHNGMDSNFFQGTDCTLSVKSLLGVAPEIPTIEELADRGQRNWKDKIKRPLETSLNELINLYPLITKWEYRNTATGETYSPEEAQALTWDEYKRLMIDWVMKEQPPGQMERRAKRLEEKQEYIKAGNDADRKKGKKRGRPRKKQ